MDIYTCISIQIFIYKCIYLYTIIYTNIHVLYLLFFILPYILTELTIATRVYSIHIEVIDMYMYTYKRSNTNTYIYSNKLHMY